MVTLRIEYREPIVVDGQPVTETTIELEHLVGYAGQRVVWDSVADNVRRIQAPMSDRAQDLRRKYPNHGKSWRPEEVAELLRLFGEGMDLAGLMARFGRSRSSIRQALAKAGVVPPDVEEVGGD